MNDITRLPALSTEPDTVELTVSLLVSLSSLPTGSLPLTGKTLGLVNAGTDAVQIARRAMAAFGMLVKIFDEGTVQQGSDVDRSADLEDLVMTSDYIVLAGDAHDIHSPLLSARHLNRVKPDACLINVGSPDNVDQLALMNALWFETIGGAAMGRKSVPAVLQAQFAKCSNTVIWTGAQADEFLPRFAEGEPRLVA